MQRSVSAREANQQFSRILRDVEAGAEILVTRRGRPVARIVPAQTPGERQLTPEQEAAHARSMERLAKAGISAAASSTATSCMTRFRSTLTCWCTPPISLLGRAGSALSTFSIGQCDVIAFSRSKRLRSSFTRLRASAWCRERKRRPSYGTGPPSFRPFRPTRGALGSARACHRRPPCLVGCAPAATAERHGCNIVLSENMQDGARFGGITILIRSSGKSCQSRSPNCSADLSDRDPAAECRVQDHPQHLWVRDAAKPAMNASLPSLAHAGLGLTSSVWARHRRRTGNRTGRSRGSRAARTVASRGRPCARAPDHRPRRP